MSQADLGCKQDPRMAESPGRAPNCSSKQGKTWVSDHLSPENIVSCSEQQTTLLPEDSKSAKETPGTVLFSSLQSLACPLGTILESVAVPSQEDISGGRELVALSTAFSMSAAW